MGLSYEIFYCVLLRDGTTQRPVCLVTKDGGAGVDDESRALLALGFVLDAQTRTTLLMLRDSLIRGDPAPIRTSRGCVTIRDGHVAIATDDVEMTLSATRCAELVDGWRTALEQAAHTALRRTPPTASVWQTCPDVVERGPTEYETVEIVLTYRDVPAYLLSSGGLTSSQTAARRDIVANPGARSTDRTRILRRLVDSSPQTGRPTPARMSWVRWLVSLGLLPSALAARYEETGVVGDRDWDQLKLLEALADPIVVDAPRWVLEVERDGQGREKPPWYEPLVDGVDPTDRFRQMAVSLETAGWTPLATDALHAFDPAARSREFVIRFGLRRSSMPPPWG